MQASEQVHGLAGSTVHRLTVQSQPAGRLVQEEYGAQIRLEQAGNLLYGIAKEVIQRLIRHHQARDTAQHIGAQCLLA